MASKKKKLNKVGTYANSISEITGKSNKVGTYKNNLDSMFSEWRSKLQKKREEEEREQASKSTDAWKDRSVSYQNSTGNNYGSYREKQIIDSNGGRSGGGVEALKEENNRLKERQNQITSRNTDIIRNMSVSDQNSSGNNYAAYRAKQIIDSNGGVTGNGIKALDEENRKESERYEKLINAKKSPTERYSGLGKEDKSGLWDFGEKQEVNDITKLKTGRDYINSIDYDQMLKDTQADLAQRRGELNTLNGIVDTQRAEALDKTNEYFSKKPYQTAGDVFDLVNGWDLNNEEKILNGNASDDEKANAQTTHDRLTGEADKNRQNAIDRAEQYLIYDFDTNDLVFNDDAQHQKYREIMYENIMPDTYEERVAKFESMGDTESKEKLDALLDSMIAGASVDKDTGAGQYENKYNENLNTAAYQVAESAARWTQDRVNELEAEERALTKYSTFINEYGKVTLTDYMPENDRGGEAYRTQSDFDRGVQTNDVHRIYSFINGGKEYQSWSQGFTEDDLRITSEYDYALLMNDREKDIFNDYYNHGLYQEAEAFLSGLKNTGVLQNRYREYESIYTQEAAKQMPILSSVGSLMMTTADTFLSIPRTVAGWLGDESVENANSAWYAGARQSDEIQNTIANEIGGIGGKTYLVGMNSLRNVINGLMTKGLGFTSTAAQSAAGLAVFASQIYQESTYKYLKETNDYNKAVPLALLDAAMETAEELLPYETMLNAPGGVLAWFYNSLSEMGEELTGSTVGDYIKGFITGRNETEKRADEIFHDGGYMKDGEWTALDTTDQEKALNEAGMQALREKYGEIIESAVGGFAGGGLGGLYSAVGQTAETYSTGRQVNNERNTKNGVSGAEQLVTLGENMRAGSESKAIAEEIRAKLNNGETVSNYALGKLYYQIAQDTGAQQEQVVRETVQRTVRDQLREQGVEDENVNTYAGIITNNLIEGGRLSSEDQSTLAQDERAIDVWKSYNTNDMSGMVNRMQLAKQISENSGEQDSIANTLGELTSSKVKGSSVTSDEVYRAVKNTKTDAEAIDYLKENNSNLISEEYAEKAKELLESDSQAKKTKTYVDDVMKIRTAGMVAAVTGSTSMPTTNLSNETAQTLFDMAKNEFTETDALRLENNKTIEPGKGTAVFIPSLENAEDSAQYGTDAWQEKVAGLSKRQRNQMGAVSEVAVRLGHNVQFINDESRKMVNGWEIAQDGTIVINVATGMKHSMLATVAHEMTHWLEHNSEQGYAKLRTFIVNSLQSNGENVEQILMDTIRNQDRVRAAEIRKKGSSTITSLGINDAMAELVAKSCESLLTSKEMKDALQAQDPTLYGQVKKLVKNVVARIDSAIREIDPSLSSRETIALRNQRDQIAKLWLEAHEDAEGRESAESSSNTDKIQNSISERKQTIDLSEALKNPKLFNDYFTYNNLIKKDPIVLIDLSNNNVNTTGMSNAERKKAVIDAGINNTKKHGTEKNGMNFVHVGDTGTDVRINNNGLRHSYDTDRNYEMIVEHIGELINQSVLINTADGREDNQTGTYILLAAGYRNDNRIVYAAFHINRYTNEMENVDVLYSIKNRAAASLASKSANSLLLTAPTISIAKAFEDVKKAFAHILPTDVLNTLGEQRRTTKDTPYLQHSVANAEELDAEYEAAVNAGDMARAEEMLLEKLAQTEGIIGYRAPNGYAGQHREVAKQIKTKYGPAIARAVDSMASRVPDNAVLIPMPPSSGEVTTETDTYVLAKALGEATGRPVLIALQSDARESRFKAKQENRKGVQAEEMGFRQVAEIPEGMMPVFVDNVVGKGVTAQAAHDTIGSGITLAYAKATRGTAVTGLKEIAVTYDKNHNLIPLSRRLDISNPSVKYSVEQMDEDYLSAVHSGNIELQQEMVDRTARLAGYVLSAYHGTGEYFTTFNRGYEGIHIGNLEQASQVAGNRFQHRSRTTSYNWGYVRDNINNMDEEQRASLVRDAYLSQDYFEDGEDVPEFSGDLSNAGEVIAYADSIYQRYAKQDNTNADKIQIRMRTFDRKTGENVMNLYARISNPFVVNGDIGEWSPAAIAGVILNRAGGVNEIQQYNGKKVDISGNEIQLTDEQRETLRQLQWMEISGDDAKWDALADVLNKSGYDGIQYLNTYEGDQKSFSYIALKQSDVKSADPVTYDDDGNVIPLSERFNVQNNDIRYSVEQGDAPVDIENDNGDPVATLLPGNTVAATEYSLSSYTDLHERSKMIKALKKAGYSQEEIDKWIGDLDSIAVRIFSDRAKYDFVADRSKKFLKDNGDVYKKTLDASTMCKKTRLYNGTFNLVQHLMPNTILMPEDLIDLYNIMKDMDLETPCGICYVQSRRRLLGQYTEEWLAEYKGEYIPKVDEVTTSDGLEQLKIDHPQTYTDFVDAMNKKGVNNPKLVQARTDYRGDIRGMRQSTIDYLKRIGGLRIQSFSDFETVHMLDMMQAVLDMKAMGLTAQAYTKVPEFAWIFGRTGIKINLSLIGKGVGVDRHGNLVLDDAEGMPFEEAMKLRNAYSENVGTIIVGINDEHIIAAMGDSRIDFIIPFHKSGWSQKELEKIKTLRGYSDYTDSQNEYNITGRNADGSLITSKAESNLDPLSYWDYSKNGELNARRYLEICAEEKIVPKFSQFLTDNGDGTWSLPEGTDERSTNIREGYWKTLIDFKMYDNEGNGAPQQLVEPNFNMEQANRILTEYDGSHWELPESWEAAEEYVRIYKEAHPLDEVRTQYSVEQPPDMDVERFMMGLNEFHMNTEQERVMLRQYKELKGGMDALRFKIDDRGKRIAKLEAKENKSVKDREDLRTMRNIQQNDEKRMERMERELVRVTSDGGYAKLMFRMANTMSDLVTGRTSGELKETVKALNDELDNVTREMNERSERIAKLAESEAVLRVKQQFNGRGLRGIANRLKQDMNSTLDTETIENRLALIALKMKQGEFDAENTQELAEMLTGKMRDLYDSYIINTLKGSTIVLSPVQLKELKATKRTLADVRSELAGTGIRISTKGNTTLDAKWDELCDMIPSLNRDETATNQLDALLNVIRSEKNSTANVYGTDEGMMEVSTKVLEAARDLIPEIVTDEKSLKLIRETLSFVSQMSREAKSNAEAISEISSMISRLKQTAETAGRTAQKLGGNIQDAIEYFNELSEQSEAAIWKRERILLIEQLKSENTQAILEEQAKWKARIAKDATVREMRESNLQLRKKISTNYGRMRKLLIAETDQKNIPEHMKSLARYMVSVLTENDLTNRKITGFSRKDLAETKRILDIMNTQDGVFSMDDLRMIDDEEAQAAVAEALADLEDGVGFYNASTGKDIIANMQAFSNSLTRISEAVTTITNVINAERTLSFLGRRMEVADAAEMIRADMRRSRFKGELAGRGSKAVNTVKRSVVYGNTTPVYYFRNLRNRGMDLHWQDMTQGENRNGLEMQKAQDYLGALAEKTGYKAWAGEKHKVSLGGFTREITIENMMELYAIWNREQTDNPEMSQHLAKGGVYIEEEETNDGKLRHERKERRAIRVTDEEVQAIRDMMTDEQKEFMDRIVSYLSNEMSALGNEASMRMYGIKKYKESYYFPMKVWDGVKSARSDRGISGTDENRAAHKSWSKRRKNMASNALVIGNFTTDAVNHIVEMINYNTMSPAIENINKVLNYQFTEGETADDATNRNLRVMFQEAYGKESLNYLETLMKDLNGGTVQDQRKTLRDRMLSVFKKNAVAGSMSVALQQPLSYIRAAMMISPKYLAAAISPAYWKGSYEEMTRYSGVAVIKNMGRFDMNFGQSAKDYITPETKLNVYEKVSDILTKAPELMDRMTWTRMWTACKLETAAKNKGMDQNSEAFMQKVAERFNEVMRRTQVYDSVLVKSSNMRSQKWEMKLLTSFMAEPTLSLNVLADAVRNAKEKGGMATLGKAGATFMLSAICQALVKGLMGSGRTPDDKKTWEENFLNKWYTAFLSESDVLGLIPGYSDIVELIKKGELQDDAMGALGKVFDVFDRINQIVSGKGKGVYRDIEDTAAQIAQLFTNIPAKNLMRDARAMYNWITQETYANRATSGAVVKYQTEANFFTADTLIGAINAKLGEAGFKTNNAEYYERIYNAMKNGNTQEAEDIREYLTLGKGVKDETVESGIKSAAKNDSSLSDAERSSWMIDNGMMDKLSDITGQYSKGKLDKKQATDLMKQMDPDITADEIFWQLDRVDWQNETGAEKKPTGYFYRLKDAVNENKADQIQAAVKDLLNHGVTKEKIKTSLSDWKSEYLEADSAGKVKIRDAITKAYKAAGYTAADADKTIENWMKEKKKKDK